MSEQQNFANHGKIVPAFHFFLMPVLFLNFASWSVGSAGLNSCITTGSE